MFESNPKGNPYNKLCSKRAALRAPWVDHQSTEKKDENFQTGRPPTRNSLLKGPGETKETWGEEFTEKGDLRPKPFVREDVDSLPGKTVKSLPH